MSKSSRPSRPAAYRHQTDAILLNTLSQLRSAASRFATRAAEGLGRRFGAAEEADRPPPFTAAGQIFHAIVDELDRLRVRLETTHQAYRRAVRERELAVGFRGQVQAALRQVVRWTRQKVDSLTEGQANRYLGVRGNTPRQLDGLQQWALLFLEAMTDPGCPIPIPASIAAEQAEKLESVLASAAGARKREEHARAEEEVCREELADVRERTKRDLEEIRKLLEASLRLAGEDELARRLVGKRRGRPPKARKAAQKSEQPSAEGRAAARKFDAAAESDPPAIRQCLEETRAASGTAGTEETKLDDASGQSRSAVRKIDDTSCNPCTDLPEKQQLVSIQQDTPRIVRRRRRGVRQEASRSAVRGTAARAKRRGRGRLGRLGEWLERAKRWRGWP